MEGVPKDKVNRKMTSVQANQAGHRSELGSQTPAISRSMVQGQTW